MFVKRRSFAQARRAAGYTQESLAERLGVDRTTVARWESGEYSPQPWLRPRIAQAFGLSLGALSTLVDGVDTTGGAAGVSASLVKADGVPVPTVGYDQVPAATPEHDRLSRERGLVGAYAETKVPRTTTGLPQVPWDTDQLAVSTAHTILVGFVKATGVELAEGLGALLASLACVSDVTETIPAEWEDRLRDQLTGVLGEWAHTMNRRDLLRLLRWAATIVAAAPVINLDPDEQQRLAKAIALPSRVDERVIDHIEVMLLHCKWQEDVLGPHAVLHTVLAQRELVNSLLGECPAELRPRLLSVYSSMSTSIGTYFFDLDDPTSAMSYCDQAREAAQEARNTELAIYALCNMSYFASWQGKAHAGIDFAAAAQSLAGKTDDVLLQAYAAERVASAYGFDGQYRECMVAFDQALEGLTLPAGSRSPESPVYWVNEGFIASKQSECLLRFGNPAEAATSAQKALQLVDSSFIHGLAYCTLRLGAARVLSGDIEEAARVIGEGGLLAARIRSARLTREVRVARERLEPWRETSAVRELDERLVGCRI
jgi:DNA-binding XRE family transcriptional regulator/tetratricopeptide (TPR) repeat protein